MGQFFLLVETLYFQINTWSQDKIEMQIRKITEPGVNCQLELVSFSRTGICLDLCFSKHRPFGPMLSISRFVHMSVCSLLGYRLTVFLPPLPEVGCPICLEIRNPWGKVMERSGVTFKHFSLEVV